MPCSAWEEGRKEEEASSLGRRGRQAGRTVETGGQDHRDRDRDRDGGHGGWLKLWHCWHAEKRRQEYKLHSCLPNSSSSTLPASILFTPYLTNCLCLVSPPSFTPSRALQTCLMPLVVTFYLLSTCNMGVLIPGKTSVCNLSLSALPLCCCMPVWGLALLPPCLEEEEDSETCSVILVCLEEFWDLGSTHSMVEEKNNSLVHFSHCIFGLGFSSVSILASPVFLHLFHHHYLFLSSLLSISVPSLYALMEDMCGSAPLQA